MTFLGGLGKILGRSVKNFGRPGQFLKVWKKIRNVREKILEKMYGKKSRGSKILATMGRGDFLKFYLAPPKCVLPLKCPPPKFRDLAPPLHIVKCCLAKVKYRLAKVIVKCHFTKRTCNLPLLMDFCFR